MNWHLIPYIVIALGAVGLCVIVYKKIPVLVNLSEEEMTILGRRKSLVQKIKSTDYKQYWLNFIIGLEKSLRRVRIVFQKAENLLNAWIKSLRERSQLMTQRSREWIRQKEIKRRETKQGLFGRLFKKKENESSIKIKIEESAGQTDETLSDESDSLPISELKKPIQEEQKWIDLIVENPKNITAYKFLGLLYWKQHNYADAKASLEMAVKLGSKDKQVREVLDELEKIKTDNDLPA